MAIQSDVFYQDLIVIPKVLPLPIPPETICIFDRKSEKGEVVLGLFNENDSDDKLTNDYFAPLFFGNNATTTYKMYLQKLSGCDWSDVTEITDDTYNDDFIINQSGYVDNTDSSLNTYYPRKGCVIKWLKVFELHGLGCYRVKLTYYNSFEDTTETKYTYVTNIKRYHDIHANGTIKFTYRTFAGINGDLENDIQRNDLNNMYWSNSIRVNGNVRTSNFDTEKESVRYRNGATIPTKFEQEQNYVVKIENLHVKFIRMFAINVFMADEILITDYNQINYETFEDYRLDFVGGFEPKIGDENFSSEVEFSQYFKNFRKKRRNLE